MGVLLYAYFSTLQFFDQNTNSLIRWVPPFLGKKFDLLTFPEEIYLHLDMLFTFLHLSFHFTSTNQGQYFQNLINLSDKFQRFCNIPNGSFTNEIQEEAEIRNLCKVFSIIWSHQFSL